MKFCIDLSFLILFCELESDPKDDFARITLNIYCFKYFLL